MANKPWTRPSAADADKYGFRWDQLDVTRVCGDERGKTIDVVTDHRRITIWVSKGGRSVRVYDERGNQLLGPGDQPIRLAR
jgi:hypothetical protein